MKVNKDDLINKIFGNMVYTDKEFNKAVENAIKKMRVEEKENFLDYYN